MRRLSLLLVATVLLCSASVQAADVFEQTLTLKNHVFVPSILTVPAQQEIKLTIINNDATPAEFESYELHREKVIGAKGQIVMFISALDAGTYPFFDDFHRDSTTGTIIAQ